METACEILAIPSGPNYTIDWLRFGHARRAPVFRGPDRGAQQPRRRSIVRSPCDLETATAGCSRRALGAGWFCSNQLVEASTMGLRHHVERLHGQRSSKL